ncbi:MAG TPA: ectonucleotide pyrophosphatase/phosphodiesterase [Lysobacter sp.]|nr:ectonucleotide pyrophosphatase/phosphodiesterase [Lysobacter sp.]
MPRSIAAALAALLSCLLAACATSAPPAEPASRVPVVLISLDAFHPDYLDRGLTPTLAALARSGARAQWLNPSYPSLTFPNHYTLVTGMRPDRHGVVHNAMWDAELQTFRVQDDAAVSDARWWGGEPIWVGVERSGRRAAVIAWPGSRAPVAGQRPTHLEAYDESVPPEARFAQVLEWLALPEPQRPALIAVYLSELDRVSHDFGPDSPQTREMLRRLDAAFARMIAALRKRGQWDRVNLLVVSDHGMAPVPPGQWIAMEDMVSFDDAMPVSDGQSVGFNPRPGREAAAERRLLGRHPHYECWRRQELPKRWQYGTHPRVPAIVCQMDEGWDAKLREALARRPKGQTRGSHGYDPALPSMRALFVAHGPAFRRGAVLPPLDNVHVYPLLAELTGVRAAPNEGSLAVWRAALADPRGTPAP